MKYSKQLPIAYRKALWGMNWCHIRGIRNFEKECESFVKTRHIEINNYKRK